jgi:CDGSH-type Zn-finger protein
VINLKKQACHDLLAEGAAAPIPPETTKTFLDPSCISISAAAERLHAESEREKSRKEKTRRERASIVRCGVSKFMPWPDFRHKIFKINYSLVEQCARISVLKLRRQKAGGQVFATARTGGGGRAVFTQAVCCQRVGGVLHNLQPLDAEGVAALITASAASKKYIRVCVCVSEGLDCNLNS